MLYNSETFLPTIAAATGFAAHKFYFIHGEHHLESPLLFRLSLLALVIGIFVGPGVKLWNVQHGISSLFFFTASLLSSIVIYRLIFHPLRSFKGPLMLRISKLWHVSEVLNSQNFYYLDTLYQQYGDIVRTGKLPDAKGQSFTVPHSQRVQRVILKY